MNESIYELSSRMNSEMQNDITEITNIVRDYFKKKYFDKLREDITSRREKLVSDPPREIRLLTAMRSFAEDEKKEKIDNAINALSFIGTFSEIADEFRVKSADSGNISAAAHNAPDSSVKPDGVYDIDESCAQNPFSKDLSIKELLFVLLASGIV